jgi:hypothetical protein
MKFRILLVNYDLSFNTPTMSIQGISGKTYGHSTWKKLPAPLNRDKADAHWIELTPEEYDRCILDVSRCWHMPLRHWVPRFIVEDPIIRTDAELVPLQVPVFANTPYFTLVGIAKAENIDLDGLKSNAERVAQINAIRLERATVPA